MKDKVSDWMTKNPITIDDDASIIEAVHLMKERDVRRLPVMHKGRLAGIVTDRMLKDYSPGKATSLDTWEVHYLLSRTPVSEAMNAHPHTVIPDSKLTDAAIVIRDHKLYGLCVVNEKGDLVGILTIKDLIDALFYLSDVAHHK
ncbi:MAG TPA: CBS domain-containing protein [Thermoanaerobaculia bacterium]